MSKLTAKKNERCAVAVDLSVDRRTVGRDADRYIITPERFDK